MATGKVSKGWIMLGAAAFVGWGLWYTGVLPAGESSQVALPVPPPSLEASPDFSRYAIIPGRGISGVTVGESKEELLKRMGKPDALQVVNEGEGAERIVYYHKLSLWVALTGDIVDSVGAQDKGEFCQAFAGRTPAGIGIGSTRDAVVAQYGTPTLSSFELVRYENLGLAFSLDKDRVCEVLVFAPLAEQPGEVGAKDIVPSCGLGGVKLGMSLEKVRQILGAPSQPASATGVATSLDYPRLGIRVFCEYNVVNTILATGDGPDVDGFRGKTKSGVGIGSRVADIVAAYGRPDSFGDGSTLTYFGLGLQFMTGSDQVVAIVLQRPEELHRSYAKHAVAR